MNDNSLKALGEFGFIDSIKDLILQKRDDVVKAIGDDCACVKIGEHKLLLTVDSFLEDRHFKKNYDPFVVGKRLTTVNASDIASCGGKPLWGLISVGLPKDLNSLWIKDFYRGLNAGSSEYGFLIIGGNSAYSEKIFFDLTLIGETKKFISRSDACVGDLLFVSGNLGSSKVGLESILNNKKQTKFETIHLNPKARLDLSDFLVTYATSAIDISDGFLADLNHILESSNVGFELDSNTLPVDKDLKKMYKNYLEYALYGGEDYELIFTLPNEYKKYADQMGCVQVGRVIDDKQIYLDSKKISIKGFEHF